MNLEDAKWVLGVIAGRESGMTTRSLNQEAARVILDHLAALEDQGQSEGEQVFLERRTSYHAQFGGLGGDVSRLTITDEAWRDMGEPEMLSVSYALVEQEGED